MVYRLKEKPVALLSGVHFAGMIWVLVSLEAFTLSKTAYSGPPFVTHLYHTVYTVYHIAIKR